MNNKDHRFKYFEHDVSEFLPPQWDSMIEQTVEKYRKLRVNSDSVIAQPSVSREVLVDDNLDVYVVGGADVIRELPWLHELYRGIFRKIAQKDFSEEVIIAREPARSMVVFEQDGPGMRFAAHVDPNPVMGILYVTTQVEGSGGELVISNKEELDNNKILGPEEIKKDSVAIRPIRGKLVFLDARKNPHFTQTLVHADDKRIVVGMNYYTPSCTEDQMPF